MNNFMRKNMMKNKERDIKEFKRVTIYFAISFNVVFLLMAILELYFLDAI